MFIRVIEVYSRHLLVKALLASLYHRKNEYKGVRDQGHDPKWR